MMNSCSKKPWLKGDVEEAQGHHAKLESGNFSDCEPVPFVQVAVIDFASPESWSQHERQLVKQVSRQQTCVGPERRASSSSAFKIVSSVRWTAPVANRIV